MHAVGIRELKQRASDILRRVRDRGETIEVTYRGRTIARLVPLTEREDDLPPTSWEAWDQITDAIASCWPPETSALEAVREQRRHL